MGFNDGESIPLFVGSGIDVGNIVLLVGSDVGSGVGPGMEIDVVENIVLLVGSSVGLVVGLVVGLGIDVVENLVTLVGSCVGLDVGSSAGIEGANIVGSRNGNGAGVVCDKVVVVGDEIPGVGGIEGMVKVGASEVCPLISTGNNSPYHHKSVHSKQTSLYMLNN